jgi:hypothetical protein
MQEIQRTLQNDSIWEVTPPHIHKMAWRELPIVEHHEETQECPPSCRNQSGLDRKLLQMFYIQFMW